MISINIILLNYAISLLNKSNTKWIEFASLSTVKGCFN